jgi:RNA methyltransferase, TrmH family
MKTSNRLSTAELKGLRALTQKKIRQRENKFVLEGWRSIKDALNVGWKIDLVAVSSKYADDPDYNGRLAQARERKIPVKEISERELESVSMTVHAQGVVAVAHQHVAEPDTLLALREGVLLLADRVTDPGNVGTLIRTADWFGAAGVVLGKGSVELYNEKVVRSAIGSIFHVSVAENVDLVEFIKALRAKGGSVAALAAEGTTGFREMTIKPLTALVVGSEAHGITPEVRGGANEVVQIPRYGKAESLNVAVACGIVLAHVQEAHRAKGR